MSTSLPILTFHAIDDRSSVISFPPALFRDGLSMLHDRGYRTIDLMDAVDLVRRRQPLPDRSFVITFDDGYRDTFDEAFPVLQRLSMCATVFTTTGTQVPGASRLPSLNGRDMLAWPEMREMHASGAFRFGAHTLTHPDLTRLPTDRVESELRESKAIIEDTIGTAVRCFAYPFGRHDERSRDLARRYFDCACSDRLGLVGSASDPFAVERVDAYYLRGRRRFGIMASEFLPLYVWARNVPRRIKRTILRV